MYMNKTNTCQEVRESVPTGRKYMAASSCARNIEYREDGASPDNSHLLLACCCVALPLGTWTTHVDRLHVAHNSPAALCCGTVSGYVLCSSSYAIDLRNHMVQEPLSTVASELRRQFQVISGRH